MMINNNKRHLYCAIYPQLDDVSCLRIEQTFLCILGNSPKFVAIVDFVSHLTEIFRYMEACLTFCFDFTWNFSSLICYHWFVIMEKGRITLAYIFGNLNYIKAMWKDQIIDCRNNCHIDKHSSPKFCFTLTSLMVASPFLNFG